MPRRRKIAKREILPDPLYNSQLVTKFVNVVMRDGKKSVAERILYDALEVIREIEPYCGGCLCTYVDKEGMMEGTNLEWFRSLRASTSLEITAAGGITTYDEIRALQEMNVHVALGMAIYTGRLDLARLAAMG